LPPTALLRAIQILQKESKLLFHNLQAFFAGLAAGFFAAAGFLAFGFAAFFSAAGFFAAVFFGVLAFLGLAASFFLKNGRHITKEEGCSQA
jgi:fatty acid desaturase